MFHILLVQYRLPHQVPVAVQGMSGKTYGMAVYHPTRVRHELKIEASVWEKHHEDLAQGMRRPGCQWAAIGWPEVPGAGGDESAVLTQMHTENESLRAENALLKSQLELAESLKPVAEPDGLVAVADALPEPPVEPPAETLNVNTGDELPETPVEAADVPPTEPIAPVPATPVVIPDNYDELMDLAKTLGITTHPKKAKAILHAEVEAALSTK